MTKGRKMLLQDGYLEYGEHSRILIFKKMNEEKYILFIKDGFNIGFLCVEINDILEPETYVPLIIREKTAKACLQIIKELKKDNF